MDMEQSVQKAADSSRGTDTVMGHLSIGEIVVPREFLSDQQFAKQLDDVFKRNNTNIEEFTVGSSKNKINPETNSPEFFKKFLKKAVRAVVKPVAKALGIGGGGDGGAAAAAAEQQNREISARLEDQKIQMQAKERELAMSTQASLRARRRNAGRALLGGMDEESTLG